MYFQSRRNIYLNYIRVDDFCDRKGADITGLQLFRPLFQRNIGLPQFTLEQQLLSCFPQWSAFLGSSCVLEKLSRFSGSALKICWTRCGGQLLLVQEEWWLVSIHCLERRIICRVAQ